MKYKVLITTSGTGSRLGDITKYTNKSLVKVGKKPAISYVIESYPKNTEFVITVGYFGNQVKDFLKLAYPNHKFTFVEIDKYEGPGSSLGYSMLQAKKFLQCPFIFHACDTIVNGKIPNPEKNWIGGYRGEGSSNYRSFNVVNGKVQEMFDKGAINPDYIHIGLIGTKNYAKFWEILRKIYRKNINNSALSDVDVLQKMIKDFDFGVVDYKIWHDIGNVDSLNVARSKIEDSFRILDKADESIFIFDKFVIKFFSNEEINKKRIERGKILKGLVPEIEGFSKNFYRYKYAKGHLFSKIATPNNFSHFLNWSNKKLWIPVKKIDHEDFKKACFNFYYSKTVERIEKFLKTRSIKDSENIINGEKIPTIKKMLSMINFEKLCDTKQTNFHGDFIPDNILKNGNEYILLDWRQDFGGLLEQGDMYYDLAKLNHNLTVNHEIVNRDLFTININKNIVECDIMRKENLVQCQRVFFDFLENNDLDSQKVRLLTAIIWLNMSPLHHHPFDLFLFYFGKLNLWQELKKQIRKN